MITLAALNTPLETELVNACINGSRKHQELLYKRFYGYAMSVSMRYAGSSDEAAEIVNDSFLKVFAKIEHFDQSKPFRAWLRRIVVNTSIDYYRRTKKHASFADISHAASEEADTDAVDLLSAEEIYRIIQELPDPYRITFNLYEVEGFSHEEIAVKLGIPEGTSRSNLSRAKIKLRQLVKKHLGIAYGESQR
jgi:RNA polymerase sigma-70 factor (ECF subfamily)